MKGGEGGELATIFNFFCVYNFGAPTILYMKLICILKDRSLSVLSFYTKKSCTGKLHVAKVRTSESEVLGSWLVAPYRDIQKSRNL